MEPVLLFAIGILIVTITIYFSYFFGIKQVVKRTLAKIPNKPIGGLKTNELTKINGKALHVKEPLIAPLSRRKCIFYTVTIKERRSTGKSTYWKTLVDETMIQDFFIEKNGDYAIVKPVKHPKNYISYLVVDKKTSSGTFNAPTSEFESLLRRYNIDSSNLFGFNKSLKYTEAIIEIGEEVTVAGIAKWKSLNEPIPEYPYSKIAALESNEKQKLIITDMPLESKQGRL